MGCERSSCPLSREIRPEVLAAVEKTCFFFVSDPANYDPFGELREKLEKIIQELGGHLYPSAKPLRAQIITQQEKGKPLAFVFCLLSNLATSKVPKTKLNLPPNTFVIGINSKRNPQDKLWQYFGTNGYNEILEEEYQPDPLLGPEYCPTLKEMIGSLAWEYLNYEMTPNGKKEV